MTYSELLEIVLDARFCEGVETDFFDCNDCKVLKERNTNAPEKTCDGIAAVYKAKLRAVMKKLDEMGQMEIVRCKDCKHRPVVVDKEHPYGFGINPSKIEDSACDDWDCPYLCSDPYYNIMPKDDWFCHRGEVARMAELPIGNYRPFDPTSPVGSCNCAYPGPYNEQCEFYHKEYHMGGYISTCLNQDIFGWCECNRCPKNKKED